MNVFRSVVGIFFAALCVCAQPTIQVTFPAANAKLANINQTYLNGRVTPAHTPLKVNGQAVTPWRTGSFICMVSVTSGVNTVILEAGTTRLTHTFVVAAPAVPDTSPRIRVQTPTVDIGVLLGTEVPLVCSAPPDQNIVATVGERSIALKASTTNPGLYSGNIVFSSETRNAPVTFHGLGTQAVKGGSLSARAQWPDYQVTGPLFETRAFERPGDGATLAFFNPAHKFMVQGAGFTGDYTAIWLDNKMAYIHKKYLSAAKGKTPARSVTAPDLRKGWPATPPRGKKPSQITIVLDPGHGGTETGALGPSGLPEKQVNLQQALIMRDTLRRAGFKVVLTRESDINVGLYQRANIAYQAKADAFISIHYNATAAQTDPRKVRHVTTYAWNTMGRELAQVLQPHIAAVTPIADRGVSTAAFVVCRNPIIPACLLELDFINLPEGEEAIQQPARQTQVAQAILSGLLQWTQIPQNTQTGQ